MNKPALNLVPIDEAAYAAEDFALMCGVADMPTPEEPSDMEPPVSGNGADTARPPVELEIISAASFAGQPIPRQRWLVPDLIPAANVTILSGDGATGKSLLGLQLAVATATACEWIGTAPEPGKVLFVSAEDEIEEIHRRLVKIEPDLSKLGDLSIVPMAGKDAVLAAPEGRDGLLHATPTFTALRKLVTAHRPSLLVLDTLADLFGGDEIKKVHARQFVGLLRGLALDFETTILLLAHPSQSGMSSGEGTSGNTAWNNSVRSRLYLERRKTDRGAEDDTDIRTLTTKKANRAAVGSQIVVRYCDGKFVRENDAARIDDREREAARVFIELLKQFEIEGRDVSHQTCSTYAPKQFAEHPSANKISKAAFKKAMDQLFDQGKIKIVERGSPSHLRKRIALVGG
jgi:RecA-family ATPase